MSDPLPTLALTMGDPAGIGPEVVLKALTDPAVHAACRPVVFGNRSLLTQTYLDLRDRSPVQLAQPDALEVVECGTGSFAPGKPSAESGALSFAYLEQATKATLAGRCQAVVTAPIAKSAWHLAGHFYPGQTEVLAQLSGTERYGMLFVARSPFSNWTLRVLLATTHIALRQVPEVLTPALVESKLQLLLDSLQTDFGIDKPRIAVAGLNPHSGEEGQIGTEERDWLASLIGRWQDRQVHGPVPPDTLWVEPARAWWGQPGRSCDAYLALYHDQGLIPVKMLAFDQAVNTTIGLPIIRTSPDHGTAFDIAGQGIARCTSMTAAIVLAAELACRKNLNLTAAR